MKKLGLILIVFSFICQTTYADVEPKIIIPDFGFVGETLGTDYYTENPLIPAVIYCKYCNKLKS